MSAAVLYTKSIASGSIIVIGCSVFTAGDNIYISALLFTVALCAICNLGIPLYTGAAGFAETKTDYKNLGISLLGNMTGCAVMGLLISVASPELSSGALAIVERKVYPAHIALILSFVCGMLMYIAVYTYRAKNSYIGILLCVPTFIIAGFEHSIAYMGYMALGRAISAQILINMLIFSAGNGIGALALGKIVNIDEKVE